MIGPTMWHGPHHGAQQSSSTGRLLFCTTSCWKLSSVTMTGFVVAAASTPLVRSSGVPHLPHFASCSAAWRGSTRFLVPHLLQATITIISSLQRLYLQGHKLCWIRLCHLMCGGGYAPPRAADYLGAIPWLRHTH